MTRMRQLCALCLAALLAGEAAALQVRERSNERHSRRLAGTGEINRNFLFYDYDSSGIAISQDTLAAAGRAALISPRHFVTSSHTSGTHPNTVTFLAGDGTSRAYPVDSYRHVSGSTDLTIGTLAERIPPEHGIAHYAIARVIEPGYDSAMIGLFGMSGLAGINRLDGGTTPASEFFRHDYDVPPASLFGRGGDEAAPTMGDSGHAMVAAYAGRLFVLGVHYTTTTSQSVPRHIDAIRAIVEADGEELTVLDTMTVSSRLTARSTGKSGTVTLYAGVLEPGAKTCTSEGKTNSATKIVSSADMATARGSSAGMESSIWPDVVPGLITATKSPLPKPVRVGTYTVSSSLTKGLRALPFGPVRGMVPMIAYAVADAAGAASGPTVATVAVELPGVEEVSVDACAAGAHGTDNPARNTALAAARMPHRLGPRSVAAGAIMTPTPCQEQGDMSEKILRCGGTRRQGTPAIQDPGKSSHV